MIKKINILLLVVILGGVFYPPSQAIVTAFALENETLESEPSSEVIQEEKEVNQVEIPAQEETSLELSANEVSSSVVEIQEIKAGKSSDIKNPNPEKINVSQATNDAKIMAKAGENEIKIATSNNRNAEQNYIIDSNKNLFEIKDLQTKSQENTITVQDQKIIATNSGIIQTKGGYNKVLYMYQTLEDAKNDVNGTTISGGGFDGTYYQTENFAGEQYVKVEISGYEGYMKLEDVQIIPETIIQSQSYYENIAGEWIYNEAVSPLNSTEYTKMPVDVAPNWAEQGVKYYSNDDENFTTSNVINQATKSTTKSASYFQNLPFRSSSNYTASQYKSFLKSKGFTNSKYYNSTNSFVETQDKYYINSLLVFAMANHEGYFGTSNLSQKCNNFFGRGAFNSNPENACINYGFDAPRDGILAQGIFLTQNYADVDWFGYHGTEAGNKDHGMNVSYASDPNWGKSLSSMMYSIDSYLGGKDNNYFRIYEIKNSEPFYTSSSLATKVKKKAQSGSEKSYYLTRNDSKNPRVVVTGDTSKAFEAQVPMPKNNKGEAYCTWTDANQGNHSAYDGWYGGKGTTYSNPIKKNTANFACDYASWTGQQSWYPKKDANGKTTYNIINNVSAKNPDKRTTTTTYYDKYEPSKNIRTETVIVRQDGKVLQEIVYTYEDKVNGKEIDYKNQVYNIETGQRNYYRRIMHRASNGTISYDSQITYTHNSMKKTYTQKEYNTKGNLIDLLDRKYSTSTGKEIDYIHKIFNEDEKRTYYSHLMHQANGKTKYYRQIICTSTGRVIEDNQNTYYSNGVKSQEKNTKYDKSNGKELDYKNQVYNDKGKRNYYRRMMHNRMGNLSYNCQIMYTTSGMKTEYKQNYYFSSGENKQNITREYNEQNGIEIDYTNHVYKENKTIEYYRHIIHRNNGIILYDRQMMYDDFGKLEQDIMKNYNSNGKYISGYDKKFNK